MASLSGSPTPDALQYLELDDLLAAATAYLGRPPDVRDWGLLQCALARQTTTVFGQDA